MNVRTRIAPSPTGYPHIGTVYQALFNYAYSKKNGGRFIVRIEDTDRARFVEGSEEVIFKALDWAGLIEDESARKGGDFGPYRQSERLSIYHEYAQKLLDLDHAYFSYYKKEDSGEKKDYLQNDEKKETVFSNEEAPKTISEMIDRGDWVLRMRVPKGEKIVFHDEIRGDIEFDTNEVTEQVIIKSDGFPTYHFAVVVDDHLMEISHILRAEEWISSTPKHVLLYKYFDWAMPPIYHTATLRNPDKSKLSKRHGHTNVVWFQESGYLPEAVINFLALLGWTHPEEKEIFSLEEFMNHFDFKDVRPVAPVFDLKKLDWMNGEYIRNMSDEELKKRLLEFDLTINTIDNFEKYIPLAKTRMKTLMDFKQLVEKDSSVKLSENQARLASELKQVYVNLDDWSADAISTATISTMKSINGSGKDIYVVLTGKSQGIPFDQMLEIQGRDWTISWIDSILK